MSGTQRLSSFFRDCRSICRSKNPHSSLTETEEPAFKAEGWVFSPYNWHQNFQKSRSPLIWLCQVQISIFQPLLCCPFCCCVTKHQNCKMRSSSLRSLFRLLGISLSSKDLQQYSDFRDQPPKYLCCLMSTPEPKNTIRVPRKTTGALGCAWTVCGGGVAFAGLGFEALVSSLHTCYQNRIINIQNRS